MSIELRPLGVNCNISCHYCYQHPQRDAGNLAEKYDLAMMKEAVQEEPGPFTLFGGEPLLLPGEDLEELWRWGFQQFKRNGIQTNGILINEDHIRLFKQYKVHVGISIDGPGELNDLRWAGSLEKTRSATAKTEAAIERLCREGISPSLIVTLHRHNAARNKLPIMHDWFRQFDRKGILSARLHVMETENPSIHHQYALSTEENINALMSFADLEHQLQKTTFDIFSDMKNLLLGKDKNVTCTWRGCDPYTTSSVRGIEGCGRKSNCGRTNKDGIDFVKAGTPGYERCIALYHTPREHGGCQGCRFFLFCKGQCPGTAIEGDWRNRSEFCDIWLQLYQHVEKHLAEQKIQAWSLKPERLQIEQVMLKKWAGGSNPCIEDVLGELFQQSQE